MKIDLDAIGVIFDGVVALDTVTSSLEGQVIGILGSNGSGKTTLLKILAGLVHPTHGSVRINGVAAVGPDPSISYLPQETGFFPFLQRPLQTLSLSLELRGIRDVEAPQRILSALGLDKDRSAAGFSGGMKQKLRIAQALVHHPRILLLDEPTTGLDVRERFRILRLIERLREQVDVVFSTHAPEDAAVVCDQVLILAHGQDVAAGNPADLRAHAQGKVFEVTVPGAVLPAYEDAEIVHAERARNHLRVRLVGVCPPGGRAVDPTLEDAYVLLTSAAPPSPTSSAN